ncbi:MAG: hypothetical protein R3350_02535, partial [Saprospiraceae bacterium]|nr:hypothetical protein [Saprospiraceae bacterium]
MRKRLRYSKLLPFAMLLIAATISLMSMAEPERNTHAGSKMDLAKNTDPRTTFVPPTFIDPVPNDTTVNCIDSIPDPVDLTASDPEDGDTEVSPIDDPDPSTIPVVCST